MSEVRKASHDEIGPGYVRFWIEQGTEVAMLTAQDFRTAMRERDELLVERNRLQEAGLEQAARLTESEAENDQWQKKLAETWAEVEQLREKAAGLDVEHEIQRQTLARLGIEWTPGEPFYSLVEGEILRLRSEIKEWEIRADHTYCERTAMRLRAALEASHVHVYAKPGCRACEILGLPAGPS